jgi:hypothetical protein
MILLLQQNTLGQWQRNLENRENLPSIELSFGVPLGFGGLLYFTTKLPNLQKYQIPLKGIIYIR